MLCNPPAAGQQGPVVARDERGELPFREVRGQKFYLDELDVVGFLDGQASLRPFDEGSYNAGKYLWKKIADIDPERRCRWDCHGTRRSCTVLNVGSASTESRLCCHLHTGNC